MTDVLGLIPARSGSKGIPHKNIRPLAGKPLISYTIQAAQKSRILTRSIVSTDSDEIAALAQQFDFEVPFRRPSSLATDSTPMLDVIYHALRWLHDEEGFEPAIVVLLQPTAPLRMATHIDEAVSLLMDSESDAIVSVVKVPGHYNPHWQFQIDAGHLQVFTGEPLSHITSRRQDLSTTYTRNGAIYAVKYQPLMTSGSLYGQSCLPYVMPAEVSVNIDNWQDWQMAEALLQGRHEESV